MTAADTFLKNRKFRQITYLAGFFLNVHMALSAYVNSSFLASFMSEKLVGLVFVITSLMTIIAVFEDEYIVHKFGSIRSTSILVLIAILSVLPLINLSSPLLLVATFIIYYSLGTVIRFNLDLYLENFSDTADTGKIRGFYLTIANLAWLFAPIIAGELVAIDSYWKVYMASGLALFPLIYLTLYKMKDGNKNYGQTAASVNIRGTLVKICRKISPKHIEIYNTLFVTFILGFFYSIMVIYTPIYLNRHIGLEWEKIGIIFTVMLAPFVLFQLPLGRLADRIGERTIMTGGLLIMAAATAVISFISTDSVILWAAILFLTRVGAAAIEAMTEIHLFKTIDNTDVDIMAISRNIYPFANLAGPVFGVIFLLLLPIKFIFVSLAVITLLGLRHSLALRKIEQTV